METCSKTETVARLHGSFLLFMQTFFPLLNGKPFILPAPIGRESHVITMARELTKCARLETDRLIINVPPGHGKSTMLSFWIAWTLSQYPDSRYLYVSYSHTIASKQTDVIRRLMSLPEYGDMFGVYLRKDSKAKDHFMTTAGGEVRAFGSRGSITGQDAGWPGLDRFSGALVMDDMIKPDDAHSDTIRGGVLQNYSETIDQRPRGINVPRICIGQRVHEADLPAFLLDGGDGHEWKRVILKSIDECGNALYPEAFPLEMLKIKEERDIYVFSAQHQQDPQPAGGALFKPEFFVELDEDPEMIATFITADTAETDKYYNDATAIGFYGLYRIKQNGVEIDQFGLHWIDQVEVRVEPKDLKDVFMDFWMRACRHKTPPLKSFIEKKSTGVTLISILEEIRGLQIINIERNKSKTQRFLDIQPLAAAKLISYTEGARHAEDCIKHMCKITANNTHANDDIADTLADAVRLALIDKVLYTKAMPDSNKIAQELAGNFNARLNATKRANYGTHGTFGSRPF